MNRKHGWLIALAIVTLLVAACGPQMATPTTKPATDSPPTAAVSSPAATIPQPTAAQPTAAQPTVEPLDLSKLPVDPDNWHVLGRPDAPVTIVEYSDFQ
jgi:protein-disulfide isomerase